MSRSAGVTGSSVVNRQLLVVRIAACSGPAVSPSSGGHGGDDIPFRRRDRLLVHHWRTASRRPAGFADEQQPPQTVELRRLESISRQVHQLIHGALPGHDAPVAFLSGLLVRGRWPATRQASSSVASSCCSASSR